MIIEYENREVKGKEVKCNLSCGYSVESGNNLSVFSKSIASYIPEDSGSAVVIPVKEYDSSTLTVPASVVIASAVIGIAVIPLLLLAIGIVIWMRRRKK